MQIFQRDRGPNILHMLPELVQRYWRLLIQSKPVFDIASNMLNNVEVGRIG
jgi:hypothetical protein